MHRKGIISGLCPKRLCSPLYLQESVVQQWSSGLQEIQGGGGTYSPEKEDVFAGPKQLRKSFMRHISLQPPLHLSSSSL